jgi:DNA primase
MPDDTTTTGPSRVAASLRSGQDWSAWLRQAHAARATGALQHPRGEPLTAVLAALVHLARRHGFAVERGDCGDSAEFVSWPGRRIRVRADTTPAQAITALAHQIGHLLLHSQIGLLDPGGTVPCAGLRKVEADSVAYLILGHLGIDTDAITFPYVSSWAGTDLRARPAATVETVTSRALAAVTTVTAYLDAELSPGGPASSPGAAVTPEPPRGHLPPVTDLPPVPDDAIVQVNVAAQAFFQSRMPASWVPAYLAARGFGIGIQQLWQAGHAPASWNALTRHLRTLGFTDTVIEASGLARPSRRGTLIDTFRNRAILPIRSADGTVIAFIGRAPDRSGPDVPKYLNSPKTSLYDKSEILFGLWEGREALAAGARPVIVEGPFDAIAVTTAGQGRFAGVAPCGTAITTQHAAALSRAADLPTCGVLVAFDPDPPGRRAAVRAYHLLSQFTAETSAVTLPAGQDPAQILTDNSPEALAATLADRTHPLADLVTDAKLGRWTRWLDRAEGRINALNAIAPVIAAMPPAHVARQVGRLSARLGLDHATVTGAITSALPEVIARRPSPSADTGRPRDDEGRAARPRIRANPPPPSTPAQTTAVSGERAAAARYPPSLAADRGRAAAQDLPAGTAAAATNPTAATGPPPGPKFAEDACVATPWPRTGLAIPRMPDRGPNDRGTGDPLGSVSAPDEPAVPPPTQLCRPDQEQRRSPYRPGRGRTTPSREGTPRVTSRSPHPRSPSRA